MSRRLLLPFAILLIGLAGVGIGTFMTISKQTGAPVAAIGGPFRLASSNGGEATDADFKGHPFLVFFGYTHCPDICPTELFQLSQMLKAAGPDKPLKVLFITVDPERDTAPVLKQYLASFDSRIIGLTGTRAQIAAVEKEYRVYARKEPSADGKSYAMDHTAIIYLMDKQGQFVSAFDIERPPLVAAEDLETYL
ncbi:MAG: SCO family protein [Methylovirgula sp.]|nr:SCO family protein [Methylovirgula sp.]